ncbi:hypothetical protein Dimus_015754 [Dionaea muscipula]
MTMPDISRTETAKGTEKDAPERPWVPKTKDNKKSGRHDRRNALDRRDSRTHRPHWCHGTDGCRALKAQTDDLFLGQTPPYVDRHGRSVPCLPISLGLPASSKKEGFVPHIFARRIAPAGDVDTSGSHPSTLTGRVAPA